MRLERVEYRVYIEDTDMMNIVYHANYIKFFERARTDWLRAHGISLTGLGNNDTYFAVKRIEVDYKSPAFLDDMVIIDTQATRTGFCQLRFFQNMFNQSNKLLSTLVAEVVCVSSRMMPKRLTGEIIKELEL
jgi:acyl-CoA thioester hydrolase